LISADQFGVSGLETAWDERGYYRTAREDLSGYGSDGSFQIGALSRFLPTAPRNGKKFAWNEKKEMGELSSKKGSPMRTQSSVATGPRNLSWPPDSRCNPKEGKGQPEPWGAGLPKFAAEELLDWLEGQGNHHCRLSYVAGEGFRVLE
jgi:hypothetical protein